MIVRVATCVVTIFLVVEIIYAKPNVVLVMADDIGLGDISFYQRERNATREPTVETPNLDQLIADGMRFSDAHSPASLCAPTRFSMLTGNFSFRNYRPFGVWNPEVDSGIDPQFTTIARIAKAGGYQTAFFGKWGLGSSTRARSEGFERLAKGARHFGFDYALELPQGIQAVPFAFYENGEWMKLAADSRLTTVGPEQNGYARAYKHRDRSGVGDSNWNPIEVGRILVDKAVDYINAHAQAPFFVYYCSQAVHIPHEPPETFDGTAVARSTAGRHGDMIRELDLQVGMLVRALKRRGVYENTLFVFTSDNGGLMIDRDMRAAGHNASNGLRGAKGSIYEGGHRVPFIAVWPDTIKPGSESDELIAGHDMVATVAALATQELDPAQVKDSMSLLPVFGGEGFKARDRYLVHQSISDGGRYALRHGPWKLVMNGPIPYDAQALEPIGLYDLSRNVSERENANYLREPEGSERANAMLAKFRELRAGSVSTLNWSKS